MYIIERPESTKGIYIIFNLLKLSAYIGLSTDMSIRTKNHLVIGFHDIKTKNQDNANLLAESTKEFWNFSIKYFENYKDEAQLNHILRGYESLFMYIVKKNGLILYNDAKNKDLQGMEYDLKCNYPDVFEQLPEAEKSLNEDMVKRFGKTLHEFACMEDIEERRIYWEKSIKHWIDTHIEKIDYFILDANRKSFTNDYYEACKILSRPRISKTKAKKLGICWGEKSLFDPELNLDKLVIISKFGSHNYEFPYEILLKKDLDLKNAKDKRCIWALRNFNENFVRELATKALGPKEPLYVLFTYTASDQTTNKKMDLDTYMTQKEIEEINIEKKRCNPPELMNFWENEEGKWLPIDKNLTYITVPSSKKGKVVGFLISDFWFAKEAFNSKDLPKYFNSKVATYKNIPWEECEAITTFRGTQSTACVRLKSDENLHNLLNGAHDMVECIIAKLEYPYVVRLQHDNPYKV